MAFLLPNLSSLPLLRHRRHHLNLSQSAAATAATAKLPPSPLSSSLPSRHAAQATPPTLQQADTLRANKEEEKWKTQKDDFYLNLGAAVRTLRDDLPSLFAKDLNYDIYRDDITFVDPLNTFQGIENYKLIFWALRFHGRILFREIGLKIFRVWQPSENMILIRWELQGVPRVPWEAQGTFQGTSRYKLDRNGKIYEHKVNNLALKFPPMAVGPATIVDLVAATCPPSPNLSFWSDPSDGAAWLSSSCSWIELYRAVRGTLEQENWASMATAVDGLVICS